MPHTQTLTPCRVCGGLPPSGLSAGGEQPSSPVRAQRAPRPSQDPQRAREQRRRITSGEGVRCQLTHNPPPYQSCVAPASTDEEKEPDMSKR
ncbi:hypothetical protein CgunFtcFv8_013473 [Champsocephalus gunnari]|uniref:Uncharacterized protein n=1 Tax=Champsocephalus gunnari TaxID=52237 RepID=A0AAN8DSH7_CHAGU|nr:hypothetical protein CgunFtcFv8_013473 [Champsocephalus gunnari]